MKFNRGVPREWKQNSQRTADSLASGGVYLPPLKSNSRENPTTSLRPAWVRSRAPLRLHTWVSDRYVPVFGHKQCVRQVEIFEFAFNVSLKFNFKSSNVIWFECVSSRRLFTWNWTLLCYAWSCTNKRLLPLNDVKNIFAFINSKRLDRFVC